MNTKLRFPRGIEIDLGNIPEDFDAIIANAFAEYTRGTAKAYTHHDKLAFIDNIRAYAHDTRDIDPYEKVKDLIKERVEYDLDECCELPDEDTFLSIDFMAHCYEEGFNHGKCDLYDHYAENHRINDKIMELIYRAIKVVMDWEG